MRSGSVLRKLTLGIAVAFGACPARSAQADPILFNPTGGATGPNYQTTALGFGAGNALAVGAITPGVGLVTGTTFTLLFQTHLTSLVGQNFVAGLNSSFQITEVATFQETVTGVTRDAAGNLNASFALVPSPGNRVSIYENNAVTFNDATGKGFTDGTEIARLNPNQLISSQFQDTTAENGGQVQFNKTGAGNGAGDPNFKTEQGSGSTNLNSGVNFVNTSYFLSPIVASSLLNSNLTAQFSDVAASTQFSLLTSGSGGAATGNVAIASNNGPINGVSGPNFQLEISGLTQSFTVQTFSVPEPASVAMTMLGLGGAGLGSFAVRRRRSPASA